MSQLWEWGSICYRGRGCDQPLKGPDTPSLVREGSWEGFQHCPAAMSETHGVVVLELRKLSALVPRPSAGCRREL